MSECTCVKTHSPANPTIEEHHYPPTSYPLIAGGKRITKRMCSNAHGIQHRLLNLYRVSKKLPSCSAYHRALLLYTIANTDWSKPIPRTVASDQTLPSEDLLPHG